MKFRFLALVLFAAFVLSLSFVANAQNKTSENAEWKSDRFIEESITPDAGSDQAIIPTEYEVVAFAMPGTGWLVGFQDIGEVKTVVEFVPAGHTINDWKEVISFQTFRVQKDVTPEEFANQIADHWKKNCKAVQSSILKKWNRDGYDAVLGLTDCPEASYSLVPEYMMYLIVRGKNRLHLIQRSTRGRDIKVNYDSWVKFYDAVNVCPRVKGKEDKCLPKANLSGIETKSETAE